MNGSAAGIPLGRLRAIFLCRNAIAKVRIFSDAPTIPDHSRPLFFSVRLQMPDDDAYQSEEKLRLFLGSSYICVDVTVREKDAEREIFVIT